MKSKLLLLVLLSLSTVLGAQTAQITGKVTDAAGDPLIGATILAEENNTGTLTIEDGSYDLRIAPGSYTLVVSYVGYQSQKMSVTLSANQKETINFLLEEGTQLDEIVVSASKRPEKLTESPATIETIYAQQIEQYAGNPAELIARQKGVDYFRAGIAAPAFNIRGFNSNFNAKNLQVTDGRFSSLIATGLPLGPLNTTIKEDIERVELILGPNATLYGPNAHNGLLNIITKDPFTTQGTTIAINPGVNGDGNSYFSGRLRHAQTIGDKFAFKVTGEFLDATEFEWADSVFIDRVGAFDSLGNVIGDGVREGYEEFQLDPSVNFLRAEAGLFYRPTDALEVNFNVGHSNSTYLSPTNVGRNQIKDWRVTYYQLKFSGDHWFAQTYLTQSRTDSTYSIDDRTKAYYGGIDAGLSEAEATANSFNTGALFQDNSRRVNAEFQYYNTFGNLNLVAGAQYQLDQANSLGTYLLDENEDDFINVGQYGGYAHLTYDFGGGFRALAAARADYHDIYEFNFVPKLGLLRIGDMGTWRLTYGQGIAAPTILNMFGDLFGGLILGNAEGFTLADGTLIEKQRVERIQTIEAGYRGQLVKDKLFIDGNAYFNISRDFLSPVTVVGVTTRRGDEAIQDVQSLFSVYGGLVATYINFGEVNTYGADLGLTYYFTPEWSINANYSFFDWSVDENDTENDFNNDGTVNFLDILVNAPTHKANAALNYQGEKFFGSVFTRWVQEFDYFSSFQIASRTYEDLTYRGVPIVEDARSADSYNYGPLGGFVTVDLNLGYRFNDMFMLSATASNLFNTELREFTAVAPTRGLYMLELRVDLPAVGKK
ncbi:MAG: TonB-dependent receptor [Bacteroidota bacterium]